jgi:hypothetical protein
VITVRSASASSSEGTWKLAVSYPNINYAETVVVANPVTPQLKEDIRWFIEDFSRRDVLNRERALNAHIAVRRCCEQFVKELKLDKLI